MDALLAMQKYEAYKDSGVDWIGSVPENWTVIPAKRRHRVVKLINKRNQCDNILSLTLRGVVNNNVENPEGLVPRDYASYQVFEKNDLVLFIFPMTLSLLIVSTIPSFFYLALLKGRIKLSAYNIFTILFFSK